ncbi:DUF6199 family natural product biosynthesis protein [Paenibacillus nuruki]|uniref:DUF6199 family natural product biosynthesis protein n=1 Tax=Paenibacillus nuruki TaxID=1886670 RepID=UPI002803C81E|nr:DUF6199 family natural product biosynthesis protein [Paenibacillus nuruki]CAJ1314512.1 DUF2065 domain-containing protein [Paenibacillus nuruki]
MFILSIILVIIGILMLIRPSIVWMVTEQWKSNGATEPSTFYSWMIRGVGVVFVVLGVLGLTVPGVSEI